MIDARNIDLCYLRRARLIWFTGTKPGISTRFVEAFATTTAANPPDDFAGTVYRSGLPTCDGLVATYARHPTGC